jgi:hypothetical protein
MGQDAAQALVTRLNPAAHVVHTELDEHPAQLAEQAVQVPPAEPVAVE